MQRRRELIHIPGASHQVQAVCHAFGKTVLAALTDLDAARHRIPRQFSPFDIRDRSHWQLSAEELEQWRSQIVISNSGARMGLRRSPFDFTEYGAIQASNVLNSPRAIEVGVYVVRAFVQLREVLATHKNLAAKLARLERQTQALAMKHNTLAQNTRLQLKQVLEAIHELMAPPDPPKRPIAQSRHAAHRGDSHETTPTISGREGGLLSFTYSFQRKSMRALRVVQFNASLPLLALG